MSTAGPIDISILVVSYNTRAMTLACLDAIAAETRDVRFEVIVVDNASSDGSAAAIAAHPLQPRLLALSDNVGFARANNIAAAEAQGAFILLLNPDTVVLDCAIDRLHAFALAEPQALIWGGRTVFADGTLNPASCWARMTPWNLLCRATGLTGLFPRSEICNGEAFGGWARDRVREVDIVSGCFLLIPRTLWTRLGGFDPLFFMYGEEADLCLRARRLGARPLVTPDATIVHHGGASERTRTGKMTKLLAAKVSLIDRHWHPLLRPLGLALQPAWPLSRWLATAMLATASASEARRATSAVWREIWMQRAVWRNGYARPKALPALPDTGRAFEVHIP